MFLGRMGRRAAQATEGAGRAVPEEATTPDLVELARLGLAGINRGDFGVYASPDIVLDMAAYGMGTFKGREAAIGLLKDWRSSFEDLTIEPDEILDLGHGVVLTLYHQQGRPVGASNEALKAVGLEE